jgi:hypothetical protein
MTTGMLTFAVFGDGRPPNMNDTTGYPSTILSGIFSGAQSKGAQFVVGTGDYMFADQESAVSAQGALLLQAEGAFTGPVYHALGNHECTGATASNCPNGNETPNVKFFMEKLVPAGTANPWYRVDVKTPLGNAKFLFLAPNAWSDAQSSWLKTQLADETTYTFIVRHEPDNSHGFGAPGLGASSSLISGTKYTLLIEGHSHEYNHVSTNEVISGNGGAPLSGWGAGSNYGFLLVQQLVDGNLSIGEIDEATGMQTDTWKVTPTGQAAK